MSGKASDVSQGSPAMPAIVSIIIGSPRGTLRDRCENEIACTFSKISQGQVVRLDLFFNFVTMSK